MLKNIIIILMLITGTAFAQMDYITLQSGNTVSELYNFNGNQAFLFKVPANFNGTTVTWLLSAYNDPDSLAEIYDSDDVLLYKFTVTAGHTYQFYPPKNYGLKMWGAIKSDATAAANYTFSIRPGKYN